MTSAILVLAVLLAGMASSAHAESLHCYGKHEMSAAKALLADPAVAAMVKQNPRDSAFVRHETCGTIGLVGSTGPIDYAFPVMRHREWHRIDASARRQGLNPLRVHAAMVDHVYPPKKR